MLIVQEAQSISFYEYFDERKLLRRYVPEVI